MRRKSAFLVLLWLAEVNIVYCPEMDTRNKNEHVCRFSKDIVGIMFDSVESTWTVDDAFLAAYQLQDVLDCAKDGETVALNTSKTIVPERTLIIRKRIVIRAYPTLESTTKKELTCPQDDSLISIENTDVRLENLIIRDCSFTKRLTFSSILRLRCDEKGDEAFALSLLNVEFWNNRNAGRSTGISIENANCVSITLKNAAFLNNDLVSSSKLTNKNDMKKTLALWHAPDTLLELDPSRDLKEEEETIIVSTSLLEAGNYSLVLRVSDVNADGITLNVRAPTCSIDEFLQEDTKQCINCEKDYYNFYPMNETCKKCPKDADCSGEYVLPHHGHWNSFPCSTHVQECLNRDACRGLENSEVKETLLLNDTATCDLSEDEIKKYRDAQCDGGYHSFLCGSCKKDYGSSDLCECMPCQNMVLILFAMIISACLLFCSAWEQIAANLELIKTRWMLRLERPSPEEREANILRARQMPDRLAEYVDKAQKAKKKFVLMMQITLNFMQGMGGCLSIYHGWSSSLRKLLTASNLISLNVSQVFNFSFECLLPSHGDMPRSVLATILALFIPFKVIGILCMYWLYDTLKLKKPWKHLVKRCILSFVSVLYVAFFSLMKTTLSSATCYRGFDAVSLDGQSVTHRYWVGDTSIRCGEGNHAILVYWITYPLLIFIFVYLCVVLYVFTAARTRGELQSEWIHETLGVLFIGFRPRFEWWDSMIQLRKILIAQWVLRLQYFAGLWLRVGITCMLTFWFLHYLHCRPYRTDFGNLNFIDGMSLFICALTTGISTILAHQLVSSPIVKEALVSIVLLINAAYVTVCGWHLVMNKFIEIKYTLLLEGVINEDDKIGVVLLKSWQNKLKSIRKLLGKFATFIRSSFDRYRFDSDEIISTSLLPSSSDT